MVILHIGNNKSIRSSERGSAAERAINAGYFIGSNPGSGVPFAILFLQNVSLHAIVQGRVGEWGKNHHPYANKEICNE